MPEHWLVVVGPVGWGPRLRPTWDSVRVKLAGPVGDSLLHALYQVADGLAYPSLYEGFGLPVREAGQRRSVLTSDRSSLPEVAGGAALLVDPLDRDAIAAGLVAWPATRICAAAWSRPAAAAPPASPGRPPPPPPGPPTARSRSAPVGRGGRRGGAGAADQAGCTWPRCWRRLAARDDLEVTAFCAPGSAAVLAAPELRLRPVAVAGAGRAARIAWTQLTAGQAARRARSRPAPRRHYSCPSGPGCPRWSPSMT